MSLGAYTKEELAARQRSVLVLMADRPGELIKACLNVDRRKLPSAVDGIPMPEPTIAHTISNCDSCGEAVWVGPVQKKMPGVSICYTCAAMLSTIVETQHFALNPAIDTVPKRNVSGGAR
jgi:hypothetical protein